jgi:CheY-like chemotaxis protein
MRGVSRRSAQADLPIHVAVVSGGSLLKSVAKLLGRHPDLAVTEVGDTPWEPERAPDIVVLGDFSIPAMIDCECLFPDAFLKQIEALSSKPLQPGQFPVPLVITSNRELFTSKGLEFPPELVFSLNLKNSNVATVEALVSRIHCLFRTWCPRFHPDLLRDFLVGKLRVDLGIGEMHHDVNAALEAWLRRLRQWDQERREHGSASDTKEWLEHIDECVQEIHKIEHIDQNPNRPSIYKILFSSALAEFVQRLEQLKWAIAQPERRRTSGTLADQIGSLDHAYPYKNGSSISISTLTRPWILVIDDEATAVVKALEAQPVSHEKHTLRLGDLCRFLPFTLVSKQFRDIRAELEQLLVKPAAFRNQRREKHDIELPDISAFEYILLDLSFGEQNKELGGLELLRVLRAHAPDTPIIIHSSYGYSSHIINAIKNGANWYSRKDQSSRVAYYMAGLHHPVLWQQEWERIQEHLAQNAKETFVCNDSQPVTDEHKYIIYKLLVNVPGDTIEIRRITSGIGGATTYYTRKTHESSNDTAPVIVKIAQPFEMLSEALRYRRFIYPFIDNLVGRVDRPMVRAGPAAAGIGYTFAGTYQQVTSGRKILSTSLREVLHENLTSDRPQPFNAYRALFDRLFDHVVPRLHQAASHNAMGDYPNPVLNESEKPPESFTFRLPPEWEIELVDVQEADCEACDSRASDKNIVAGNRTITLKNVYVSQVKRNAIVVNGRDNYHCLYRARLVGKTAEFVSRYFFLRPHKYVTVTGNIRCKAADVWSELARDLDRVLPSHWNDPIEAVPRLTACLTEEKIGIVHGDLNLGNVMVEVEEATARLSSNDPWLIDFARTRRDAIVHDFATLETSLATELLDASSIDCGNELETVLLEFFSSLQRAALEIPPWVKSSPSAKFVLEAITATRVAAAAAGITASEYLAAVALYYLVLLKIITPPAPARIAPETNFKRTVCFRAAAVALNDLERLSTEQQNEPCAVESPVAPRLSGTSPPL